MNASCASGSSQPIEAFGRQALLVEGRVEVDRLDALGRVQRGLPAVAVLGGDLAAGLPDGGQVVVLGQAVERDGVDAAALRLDRLRGGLEVVPRLRDLDAGLLQHVLAVDQRAGAGVPGLAPDLVVERRGVDERGDVVAGRGRRHRLEGALVGELRRPGGAHLGHVGHLAAGDGGGELVVRLRPRDELDVHLRARVRRLEVRRVALEDVLQRGRAGIHDPGRHLALDRRPWRRSLPRSPRRRRRSRRRPACRRARRRPATSSPSSQPPQSPTPLGMG